jgi:hypothetical protein
VKFTHPHNVFHQFLSETGIIVGFEATANKKSTIFFCFPLYLPLAALGLQRYLEDKQPYLAKEWN